MWNLIGKMASRKTQQEFIDEAIKVHGNKYDYSKVQYKNNRTKVIIVCPMHGDFQISPAGHTCMRYGCIICGGTKRRTTEEFIEKSNKLHNRKYNYSKTVYVNTGAPVIIICPTHGEFQQTPFAHTHSYGCKICSLERTIKTKIEKGLIPPGAANKTEYQKYVKDIRRCTNNNYRRYKEIINPKNLKLSHRDGYHLDHIYSKRLGFENNVPVEIIGHWTNLRIVTSLYNITKNINCDKTLNQLYEDYQRTLT